MHGLEIIISLRILIRTNVKLHKYAQSGNYNSSVRFNL